MSTYDTFGFTFDDLMQAENLITAVTARWMATCGATTTARFIQPIRTTTAFKARTSTVTPRNWAPVYTREVVSLAVLPTKVPTRSRK